MTLLIGMVNPTNAVLVADRRLTVNGRLHDDESNKIFTLTTRDARVAFAYTGLAKAGGFETRPWLLQTLLDAARTESKIKPMLSHLTSTVATTLASINVPDKRLSVMCVGYRYDDHTHALVALVSNYDAFGRSPSARAASEFTLETIEERSMAAGQVLGAEIAPEDFESLQVLLRTQRVPASALVGKGVEAIQMAASSPYSRGVIGKQCSSIIVPSDLSQPAEPAYHSETVSYKSYGLSHVEARGGEHGFGFIDSPEVEIRESETPIPLAGPRLRSNAPCWCRSGKLYRNCHGRGSR